MSQKENKTNCPLSVTLKLIGGKYKAHILWHLTGRTLRYNELRKMVPEATAKMLTQQLRELEAEKFIIRTVYPVFPPKVEYALAEKGESLFPILEAMYAWGSELMKEDGIIPSCDMPCWGRNCNKGD